MDAATGKMLNDFSGHTNEAYKIRGVFGHAEASVVCGDEKGAVWAWDLLDVSSSSSSCWRGVYRISYRQDAGYG
jgi:hypothetical protein